MKKIFLTTLLLLTLILTACSSGANAIQPSSTQENASLPIAAQLVIGTLKLDGTEQAVTADQANELLVMWQVYADLTSSDTTAQQEIDGLVEQIQETMTTEQMKAISAMGLTQQEVFALIQEQGVGLGQARQSSNNSDPQNGSGFTPPDGGIAGGPPDGGGSLAGGALPDNGIGGVGSSGSSTGTNQSQNPGSGSGASAGVPTALVNVLIQYLQQIASA